MSKTVEEGPRLESFSPHSESLTSGIIYVEEGDTKDKPENFRWHKEFNKAYDNIYLTINDLFLSTSNRMQLKRTLNLEDFKKHLV